MHLRFVDRSTCRVEGIIDNVCVCIGHSYVPVDFVVLDTGRHPNTPIILGRPFLHTANATIYAGTAEVYFYLKERIEQFPFYHPVNASIWRVRTGRPRRRAPRSGGLNNVERYWNSPSRAIPAQLTPFLGGTNSLTKASWKPHGQLLNSKETIISNYILDLPDSRQA